MSPNTGIPTDPSKFLKAPETLDQALSRISEQWRHMRSGQTLRSQAVKAITSVLKAIHGPELDDTSMRQLRVATPCEDIGDRDVQQATAAWYAGGLSPATIQKRLNCLSKLGVNVEGCRKPVPKQLKWHLPMEMKEEVCYWIEEEADRTVVPYDLARYVRWTMVTGLRLEETLRLTRDSFSKGYKDVNVPGTKTAGSQATLPLGSYARMLASSQCLDAEAGQTGFKFIESTYEELRVGWEAVRERFGWRDDPTATLKALRRTAAYHLHVEQGMPLAMVQRYLRHRAMSTTLAYLELTGGYGTEEMRRYLK
jgi:hypothetical protein